MPDLDTPVRDSRMLIIGAGGHAVSVTETAIAAGFEVVGFVDHTTPSSSLLDRPIYEQMPDTYEVSNLNIAIAIGDNYARQTVFNQLSRELGENRFPVLLHPSATVSQFAVIARGSVVLQGAVVGSAARIGKGCLINSGAIVEHECQLADFVSIAPGAQLGGRVVIAERSAVGIGSSVKQGVSIGPDSVIGAASYVHSAIPGQVVAYGIPAKIQRPRLPTDSYLK